MRVSRLLRHPKLQTHTPVVALLAGAPTVLLLGGIMSLAQVASIVIVLTALSSANVLVRNQRRLEADVSRATSLASAQRVADHDITSALLAIEGGMCSLRHLQAKSTPTLPSATSVGQQVASISSAIENEVRRVRRLTAGTDTPVEACSVVQTIEPLLQLRRAAGADVVSVFGPDEIVGISSDDLARCVSNMLDNCARYAPNSNIEISGTRLGEQYQVSIGDHGPGLPEGVRDHPFDSGTSSRQGGGLGLCSVRSILDGCGGSARIDTSRHGTTVHLVLPVGPLTPHHQLVQRSKHEVGSYRR